MSAGAGSLIDDIPWSRLRHAYGTATDVPPLLRSVATARGRTLFESMDELYSRVLHQGTIYSASPEVARVVIGMVRDRGPRERIALYGLLTGLAESARESLATGQAAPGCSVGDPVNGAAIRDAIVGAAGIFVPDLSHSEADLRAQTAELLTAFSDASPAMARLVREHYTREADAQVRRAAIDGLERMRSEFDDWPAFLAASLQRETDAGNRYALRRAQVDHLQAAADRVMTDDLVANFLLVHASDHAIFAGDERFFRTAHLLGSERERDVLLQTLAGAENQGLSRAVAERLLRLVFDDRRTGWGQTSYSVERPEKSSAPTDPVSELFRGVVRLLGLALLARACPPLFRRRMRKASMAGRGGTKIIQYWGVEGDKPVLPERLTAPQREVLSAIANDSALWGFRTNLWELFGLPATPRELSAFIAARG